MKQAVSIAPGEGESLSVLGAGVRFLCEAARTDHGFSVMEVTLPEGAGPPPHDHPWDEAYYVLEGKVRFEIGDEIAVFGPGEFAYTPGGLVHAFSGASAQPSRVLVFDAPAAAEGFFREVDAENRAHPESAPDVVAIGLRHRMRFRVPPAA
jgi:quercetin dioxygenase-like cupin family protein